MNSNLNSSLPSLQESLTLPHPVSATATVSKVTLHFPPDTSTFIKSIAITFPDNAEPLYEIPTTSKSFDPFEAKAYLAIFPDTTYDNRDPNNHK